MSHSITKVKTKAMDFEKLSVENCVGWEAVLADIQARIHRLGRLVPIVEGKIKRGEPWPGTQLAGQDSGPQHSV